MSKKERKIQKLGKAIQGKSVDMKQICQNGGGGQDPSPVTFLLFIILSIPYESSHFPLSEEIVGFLLY